MALDLNRLRGAVKRAQGGGGDGPAIPPAAPRAPAPEPAPGTSFIPGWFAVFLLVLFALAASRFSGTDGPPPGTGLQGKLQAWFYYVAYYPFGAGWSGGLRLWTGLMKLSRYVLLNFAVAVAVLGFALWLGWLLLRWLLSGGSWLLWMAYFVPAVALAGLWGWDRAFGQAEAPAAPVAAPAPAAKPPAVPKARVLEKGNAERRELIDIVRPMVEELLHPPVTFEVETVRRAGAYAYLRMTPIRPTGEPIDVEATKLKNKSIGVLTEVVLKREDGQWKLQKGTVGSAPGWAKQFCEPPYPRALTGACP